MSAQGASALWDRIQSDEQFRGQLERAATPEEKRRIVAAAGFDVHRDDLGAIRSLAGISEISDDDLEVVAGGGGTGTGVALSVTVGAAAAAALA